MEIKPDEIASILRQRIEGLDTGEADLAEVGTVLSVADGIARIHGLDNCMALEMLELPHDVTGLALNLEADNVGAVLFGEWERIAEGDTVKRTGRLLEIPVGEALLGRLVDPLGYLDFLKLMESAALMVTDSGGIQEETTFLGVPCLTVRLNTERPVTLTEGTNTLVGVDPEKLVNAGLDALQKGGKTGTVPELWDGHSGERIATVLSRLVEETG